MIKCLKCDGCGKIANTDEGEPWIFWEELPNESKIAVNLGIVAPRVCPMCKGSGEESEDEPDFFIGIDPGIYTTTFAVIDSALNLIDYKMLYKDERSWPRIVRQMRKKGQRYHDPKVDTIASDLYEFTHKIIDEYHPVAIATEAMDWSASHSDTQGWVHHFRGIIHAICIINDIPLHFIPPQKIKKCVTGNGNADKKAVVTGIYNMFPDKFANFTTLSKNNHIADAIGAGLFLVKEKFGYIDEES